MKTNAFRLAILTFFTALQLVVFERGAFGGSNSGFFSAPLGMAGMSSKSNAVYRELVEQVYSEFKKTRSTFIDLSRGERPASEFQDEFAQYCMDGDSADVVSWLTSGDSSRKISFSCVLEGEFPRIRERLFVFMIRDGQLVDIQVASADLPTGANFRHSPVSRLSDAGTSKTGRKFKPWESSNEADDVLVAVSGAMVTGGVTASKVGGVFEPKELTSREAVSGAMISGLGAAISHFIFNMAPSASGLSGGGLTLALEDMNDGVPDPLTGRPRRRVDRKGDDNGGLGPISLRLTFKFW
jgi:hypothetical protein